MIKNIDLKDKRVLLRVDYNVPIKDGQVIDEYIINWNDGSSSPQRILSAGNYSCQIIDAEGCEITKFLDIYEPINPEYVLFGLIFDSFLPLNILPNINPPISVEIQTNMIKYRNIISSILLEKSSHVKSSTIPIGTNFFRELTSFNILSISIFVFGKRDFKFTNDFFTSLVSSFIIN